MALHNQPGGDIFIVDDDAATREALALVFALAGYRVTGFADGHSFLAAMRAHTPDCVILDVCLPDRSGLEILKELNARHYAAPIFILSGAGDIAMAVDAIRNGALDFIEKRFGARAIVVRVGAALAAWRQRSVNGPVDFPALNFPGQDALTPREREVLAQIAGGASNKEAGRCLGISPRTIEVHRARIMEKLGAKNAADLVRIVLSARPERDRLALAAAPELVA